MIAALRYLRLTGFDTSTVEGRDAERYRRAAWAVVSNVGSRAMSMLLVAMSVHLTVPYLGTTRFGVWATFASMATMLSLLDLGVGNALVNRVAQAAARGDRQLLRRTVSGGAGLLGIIGVVAAGLLSIAAQTVPWERVFKLTDAAAIDEARDAAMVFALCFGINLFSSGLMRILAGQQRLHAANLILGSAAALACVALWLATGRQAGVAWLIAATFGLQSVVALLAGVLLHRDGLWRLLGLGSAMRQEWRHLLSTGSLFMLLQLGTMLGWGSDNLILASLKGASEVALYAVAVRLFQFASQPFAVLNAPLWGAYADAVARHDFSFVRGTLKRSLALSLFGSLAASAALLIVAPVLVPAWTQGSLVTPVSLLLLLAAWTVLDTTGNAFGAYLNGCGIVRQQVWVVAAFCCVVLPIKFWLGNLWGAAGIVSATIIAYLVVVVGTYGLVLRSEVLRPIRRSAWRPSR